MRGTAEEYPPPWVVCEGANLYVSVPQDICDGWTQYLITSRNNRAPLSSRKTPQLAITQQSLPIITGELCYSIEDGLVGRNYQTHSGDDCRTCNIENNYCDGSGVLGRCSTCVFSCVSLCCLEYTQPSKIILQYDTSLL